MDKSTPSLLILPAEIRTSIFENVLDDIFLQTRHHPQDTMPPHSRFQAYVSLLLACRQVHQEVEALFRKDYAHRTVFYFEEAYKLYEFFQHMGNFPNPHDTWFNLTHSKRQLQSRLGLALLR